MLLFFDKSNIPIYVFFPQNDVLHRIIPETKTKTKNERDKMR